MQGNIIGADITHRDADVGAIMAANADHGRMHFAWATEDPVNADNNG